MARGSRHHGNAVHCAGTGIVRAMGDAMTKTTETTGFLWASTKAEAAQEMRNGALAWQSVEEAIAAKGEVERIGAMSMIDIRPGDKLYPVTLRVVETVEVGDAVEV